MIRETWPTSSRYRWQEGWEQRIPPGTPVIRLDQNTQPRPPAWYAGAAAWLARVPVNAYPDSRYRRLREAIAEYTGFPAEQVVPTAGADEALILCALLTLSPRRHGLRPPALLRALRERHPAWPAACWPIDPRARA